MEKGRNQSAKGAENNLFYNLDGFTLLKDLVKNWWVMLLAGATAFFAVSMLSYVGIESIYTANSILMVTGTVRSGNGFQSYSNAAENFIEILTDDYILQEVAEDVGIEKQDVVINASIISETNLISLSVRADNPTTAYQTLIGLQEHYLDISELMMPGYVLEELSPASYPSSSIMSHNIYSLRKKSVIAAVLLIAAVILVRSYFFDSVKNEKDVESKLDTKLVVSIYHEKKYKTLRMFLDRKKNKENALLINSPLAGFDFVETFRRMREKIVTHCVGSGKKIVLVTSMLENEGKSTVAANLALALSDISDKVALVDADLRKPAQFKIFEKKDHKGILSNYLKGEVSLEDSIKKDNESGIYLIYDNKSCMDSSEIVSSTRMEALLNSLKKQMDYIVIDSPPMSMVADAEIIAQYADYSLLVISPDHASSKEINDRIDQLNDCKAKLLGCVLNNVYTLELFLRQFAGIQLPGAASGGYKKYGAYGRIYSYRYGYGYGYGSDSNHNQREKADVSGQHKKKSENYREVLSGEDFFAERIEKTPELEGEH